MLLVQQLMGTVPELPPSGGEASCLPPSPELLGAVIGFRVASRGLFGLILFEERFRFDASGVPTAVRGARPDNRFVAELRGEQAAEEPSAALGHVVTSASGSLATRYSL
jgi:hypothetical protein